MNTELTEMVLAIFGILSASVFMLSFFLLRMTLTRRIKKYLKPRGEYWNSGTLDFDFINTAIFCWTCVIPSIRNSEKFKIMYGDFDVRLFAKKHEVTLSFSMISGLAIFFILGGLTYILKIT